MKLVSATGYVSEARPDLAHLGSHMLLDDGGQILFVLRAEEFDLDPVCGQLVRLSGLEKGRVIGAPRRVFVQQLVPLAQVPLLPPPMFVDPFAGPAIAEGQAPAPPPAGRAGHRKGQSVL